MKYRFILLIVFILTAISSFSQPPEVIYQGTAARSGYVNNGSYGPFNIGFSFTYFGNTYTQFYVTSNGLVLFGAGSTDGSEDPIPTTGTPNNYIAGFWDDLTVDGSGNILYTTVGASPNRKLIIQFRNMGFYPFPPFFGTFSVILYETSNVIQVQYRLIVDKMSPRAHGSSATIGIENADGTAGVQYSYHASDTIYTGKAISFTPSGSTYTVNSDAVYDGVYLTTNINLPEPGIILLTAPGVDAVIGSDYKFEWAAASNAASYTLYISNYSDLTEAQTYSPGSALSYDVSGLLLDTTYYWGVFSRNATGTTWCELSRFFTSSTPPLAPVSQTRWVEQNQEEIIQLRYTGGDAGPKTATITSLPPEGLLYQYSNGSRGQLITSVPANVTDPSLNVIYLASGSTGNNAGNFKFRIHDGTGDSAEGLVTINVISAVVPNFVTVAKGTGVEVQFDVPMSDPSGKQNQFTVKVNGNPVTITSASLKEGDPYTISLVLETPLTGTETVTVSYTQGDVTGRTGGLLTSFADQSVTLRAQTINFPELTPRKYGDPAFALTATSSSGLGITYSSSNQTVATISGSSLTVRFPGTSDITARQAGNATYAPARYIRPLTVGKADLTFTADNKSRPYLQTNPELTYTITGFVLGENQSVLDELPVISTTAAQNSPGGDYPITFTGGSDNNYNYVFVNGILTVTRIDQTITFTSYPDKLRVGETKTLSATSTSGLPVLFQSLNTQLATVSGNQITGVSRGNVQIKAYHPGNESYNPAEALVTIEILGSHKDIMHLFTPNNDGFNDLWELPEIEAWGKCDVKVYNRWGKPVFSSPDYNNTWDGTSDGKPLPEGAYYFVIKTQNAGTITGTVNILR